MIATLITALWLVCICLALMWCYIVERRLDQCKHTLEESVQLMLLIEQDARKLKHKLIDTTRQTGDEIL